MLSNGTDGVQSTPSEPPGSIVIAATPGKLTSTVSYSRDARHTYSETSEPEFFDARQECDTALRPGTPTASTSPWRSNTSPTELNLSDLPVEAQELVRGALNDIYAAELHMTTEEYVALKTKACTSDLPTVSYTHLRAHET